MSYSTNNTFEMILNRVLSNPILENLDKRIGSIIYDAIAPVCLELAEAYMKMDILEGQTSLLTATGEMLDNLCYNYGVKRKNATQALRIAEFKQFAIDEQGNYIYDENGNRVLIDMDIPEGSRFAVVDDTNTFEYMGVIDGYKVVKCEQSGISGNNYIGTLLPLIPIFRLAVANIIGTLTPAQDEEIDDDLRDRTIQIINTVAFGGNIEDYIEKVNAIDGVGNTKVFPAWVGNGSVLLSVVDSNYNPCSTEFLQQIKEMIDPEDESGSGIGIAPIGHYVTLTTPTEEVINISLILIINSEFIISELRNDIKESIENYIEATRKTWGQNSVLSIYRSKVIEAVLSVQGVVSVTSVLLNGLDEDITYEDAAGLRTQYLPKLGDVNINE